MPKSTLQHSPPQNLQSRPVHKKVPLVKFHKIPSPSSFPGTGHPFKRKSSYLANISRLKPTCQASKASDYNGRSAPLQRQEPARRQEPVSANTAQQRHHPHGLHTTCRKSCGSFRKFNQNLSRTIIYTVRCHPQHPRPLCRGAGDAPRPPQASQSPLGRHQHQGAEDGFN